MLRDEFNAILADPSKSVVGDITWRPSDSDPAARTFRVTVAADGAYPLFVQGWFSPRRGKLSFSLICDREGVGRIYGLDIGASHRNPDDSIAGDPHKNYWKEGEGDNWAYEPQDISAPWDAPVLAWSEFCAEAHIRFFGIMQPP